MSKIKICGLSRIADIEAVNNAKADYAGFVFAPSKRRVTLAQASVLKSRLDPNIQAVGVFANADIQLIRRAVQSKSIDSIQLHGQENEEYLRTLRTYTDLAIIKAFGIASIADIKAAECCSAEYILLDYHQAGSGQSFDWQLLTEIKRPYFLAGGLNIDNIITALSYQPFALDISSGVEIDGYKAAEKILQITRRIRNEQR